MRRDHRSNDDLVRRAPQHPGRAPSCRSSAAIVSESILLCAGVRAAMRSAFARARASSTVPAEHLAAGLWRSDPSVWSDNPAVQKTIADRLGWMSSPALMAGVIDRLNTFATKIKGDGFTDVVLLGMGGSSLAPEVLRAVLGVAPGWPRLHMLDSTDPDAIRQATTPPEHTLYLLASKSGTTIEPNSLAAYFQHALVD